MKRAIAMAVLALTVMVPDAVGRPLVTGVADVGFAGPEGEALLGRISGAGATSVRTWIGWRDVAPPGQTKPAGFDPRNPTDPNYRWQPVDIFVRRAVDAGLEPIITVVTAPDWAERRRPEDASLPERERTPGTVRPDPAEFGAFAEAIALRYSGALPGLPRVRHWQAWNEPNHHNDLNPQFDVSPTEDATPRSRMLAPAVYRELLNAFTDAVHRVHADNVVVAGGLAPFFRPSPGGRAAAPLPFMRELLCLTSRNRPRASCPAPLRFDAWSHHPYTSGDARHSANSPHDVSLGDMPEMRDVLRAAARANRIRSNRTVRFWVTEFSWDSSPPDRYGVPDRLLTRWVAEALHRMWTVGVELVTWFQVRDMPPTQHFQSGLYRRCEEGIACDRAKPMSAAFRFPFTAYRSGSRVKIWGRTPAGRAATVTVEQRRSGRWVRLARYRTDRNGIFRGSPRRRGRGGVRARVRGGARAPAFSLERFPDRPVNPFGNVPVDEPGK